MKIEFIKEDDKVVGWNLIAENEQDKLELGTIRRLHFWGIDETQMKYNGIKTEGDYVVELGFKQKGVEKDFE